MGCPDCNSELHAMFDGHQTYVQCDKCGFEGLYGDGDLRQQFENIKHGLE